MPKRYLGNKNTKEIHEYEKMVDGCKLNDMKEEHKFWLDFFFEIKDYCENKDYNGCKWCLPKYHADS